MNKLSCIFVVLIILLCLNNLSSSQDILSTGNEIIIPDSIKLSGIMSNFDDSYDLPNSALGFHYSIYSTLWSTLFGFLIFETIF